MHASENVLKVACMRAMLKATATNHALDDAHPSIESIGHACVPKHTGYMRRMAVLLLPCVKLLTKRSPAIPYLLARLRSQSTWLRICSKMRAGTSIARLLATIKLTQACPPDHLLDKKVASPNIVRHWNKLMYEAQKTPWQATTIVIQLTSGYASHPLPSLHQRFEPAI